jgi:1,4-alpha-glucan branching enzyme
MSEIADTVTTNKGMGAIPGAKGVTFRVWAPHAEKVYVTGTFNDWSKISTPLVSEKNGYWSAAIRVVDSFISCWSLPSSSW